MKPILPKLLLTALLAAQALPAATQWTSYDQGYTPSQYDDFYAEYRLSGDLVLNTTLSWPDNQVDGDEYDNGISSSEIYWEEGGSLTGNGKLTAKRCDDQLGYGRMNMQSELYLYISSGSTIGDGITLENMYIEPMGADIITINATLKNCMVRAGYGNVDLRGATLEDCDYELAGTYEENLPTIFAQNLKLSSESRLDVYDNGKIEGNVTISGAKTYANGSICCFYDENATWEENLAQNPGVSTNTIAQLNRARLATPLLFSADCSLSDDGNTLVYYDKRNPHNGNTSTVSYPQLTITGTLTVSNPTPVVFEVDFYAEEDLTLQELKGLHDSVAAKLTGQNKKLPGAQDALIICGAVSEQSVKNLKPYYYAYIYDCNYDFKGYEQLTFSAVTDREFYAEPGEDGMVHIYLRDGSWENTVTPEPAPSPSPSPSPSPAPTPTPEPEIPALIAGAGSILTLGGEGTTPSVSNPVQMQGGTADASALSNSLLNNSVFKGNSGSVKLGADQSFTITGSGTMGYNISGGNLVLSSGSNVTLGGKTYSAADTTVNAGVLTVGTDATLGKGGDSRVTLAAKGSKLTNYGKVNAGIDMASGSALLNEGIITGPVQMSRGTTAINNGKLNGKLTVAGGAKVFGSGIFADTVVESGGYLHVGNSPGFQSHKALELQSGSTLSFSVDGLRPASANSTGSGSHSQMKVESLTLSGTVNVAVDVTTGIVEAGAEPFSIDLIKATQTSGTGNFTLQLEDEMGLLDDATLSWSSGTLTLNGALSEEALSMLAGKDCVHMANTMWAAAAVMQDFARLAESQAMIGTPGQTTWWGGAFGTFLHVSDDTAGYDFNSGGYGIGLQHAFTESFRGGLAFGQSFGTYTAKNNPTEVDQEAIMPVLTAQYVRQMGDNSFSLNAHMGYGMVDNEARTMIANSAGEADWKESVFSAGLRASWNVKVSDTLTVSPFIGLTYRHVSQNDFTERYIGGKRDYKDGSMQLWNLPIGVTVRGVYGLSDGGVIAPEFTFAYINDISRTVPGVRCSNGYYDTEITGYSPDRSSFMVSVGVNWLIDESWSFGAFYYVDAREDQVDQSLNGSVRYSF